MPSVSLSPIKEFHLDLVNALHHATTLQIKLKQAEEWAKKLDRLDVLISQAIDADTGSEFDDDSGLTLSNTTTQKEKEERLLDIQRFQCELEGVVDSFQGHYETPLEAVLSAEDDALLQRYAQQLISWFESIRGHLIEILGRTSVLLEEKAERKKERKEESKFLQELLNQMAMLQTYMMKIDSKLNDIAQRQKSTTSVKTKTEPMPTPPDPDPMDVDDDQAASGQTSTVAAEVLSPGSSPEPSTASDFTTLLEDTKANLEEFHASRQTYASKADSLRDQFTEIVQNAPLGYPIIPVRSVEIELDRTIQQIVVEEFELLYGHFISSLTEETGKKEEESVSNLTKSIGEANKLVCRLLVSCLDCDELVLEDGSLNRRPGPETISS